MIKNTINDEGYKYPKIKDLIKRRNELLQQQQVLDLRKNNLTTELMSVQDELALIDEIISFKSKHGGGIKK